MQDVTNETMLLTWFTTAALLAVLALACAFPEGDAQTVDHETPATGTTDSGGEHDSRSPSLVDRLLQREPETVEIAAGTPLSVELLSHLSSHDNSAGDRFEARVAEDVMLDDVVAIPAGSLVHGSVVTANTPKIGGRAQLTLDFESLETSSDHVPIEASLSRIGKSERAKDAAIIGGSTIGGAVLGEQVDDGEGGVIGAVVGGLAGTLAAKKTEGRPLVLPAGTLIDIELSGPVTLELQG